MPSPPSNLPNVAVLGAGYVGRALCGVLCAARVPVVAIDVDEDVVATLALTGGFSLVTLIAPSAAFAAGGKGITSDVSILRGADVVVISVPTPLAESQPNYSYLDAAVGSTLAHARPGQLVIVESTVGPGAIKHHVIDEFENAGFRIGTDIFVGYAPERVDPGNAEFAVANTPRLVAGYTPACDAKVVSFYELFVERVINGTILEVELAKLVENTFRLVNISFVNELSIALEAMNVSLSNVLDLAETKPFGFSRFYSGPGVGGQCIPVSPRYLLEALSRPRDRPSVIESALAINDQMPARTAQRALDTLAAVGRMPGTVLLYGVAYKPGSDDVRESPAVPLADALLRAGCEVAYVDQMVTALHLEETFLDRVDFTKSAATFDLAVLLYPAKGETRQLLRSRSRWILDARDTLAAERGDAL